MDNGGNWLRIGLYTAAEASRLLSLPVAKVRRWLGGYRGEDRDYPPLWTPQLPKLDDQLGLGFLDLMQLRVVARVVAETEISLQKLRRALWGRSANSDRLCSTRSVRSAPRSRAVAASRRQPSF
jgi:hypothetical protein